MTLDLSCIVVNAKKSAAAAVKVKHTVHGRELVFNKSLANTRVVSSASALDL